MEMAGHRDETRQRIVEVAAELLREHGPAAVTTRGVAAAAGAQAPTIYRLFGDKDGLLDAVAEHVMATYVEHKAARLAAGAESTDPVEALRAGWRSQIAFGLENPTLFRLLSDPSRVLTSAAAESGQRLLNALVHRVAVAGRLRVSERRAVDLIQSAGVGTIHVLLSTPTDRRDPGLPEAALDAVLGQILTGVVEPDAGRRDDGRRDDPVRSAVALRACASELTELSLSERALLVDWLDRVVESR